MYAMPTVRPSGFRPSRRPPPNTFMNARFTGCIWPSGTAPQDLRDCYFTFANVGTEEGSHCLIPGRSRGIAAGRRWRARGQFYFSISDAQFKWMESGAALASSTFVMIRNLCPSPRTS